MSTMLFLGVTLTTPDRRATLLLAELVLVTLLSSPSPPPPSVSTVGPGPKRGEALEPLSWPRLVYPTGQATLRAEAALVEEFQPRLGLSMVALLAARIAFLGDIYGDTGALVAVPACPSSDVSSDSTGVGGEKVCIGSVLAWCTYVSVSLRNIALVIAMESVRREALPLRRVVLLFRRVGEEEVLISGGLLVILRVGPGLESAGLVAC